MKWFEYVFAFNFQFINFRRRKETDEERHERKERERRECKRRERKEKEERQVKVEVKEKPMEERRKENERDKPVVKRSKIVPGALRMQDDVKKLTGGVLKKQEVKPKHSGTFYPNPFFQTATKKETKKENEQDKPIVKRSNIVPGGLPNIDASTSWSTLNVTKKLDTNFKIPKTKNPENLFSLPDSQLDALFENQNRGLTRPNVFRQYETNDASELKALNDENWAYLKSIKNNDKMLNYAWTAFGNAEPSKPFISR